MKLSLYLTILALTSATAFAQPPQVAVSHSQSYFRTQTTAVSLVRVNSFSPAALNLGFTPDPNFTVTRINAPASWNCNLGSLSCSRANDGQNAFELIQFIATINASAPSTITNQATLTGDGLSSPRVVTDVVPVYRPSKVVQWGANNFGQLAGLPAQPGFTSVAQGFKLVIGLTTNGSVVQWGSPDPQTVGPPSGSGFLSVACGHSHCVAIQLDGSLYAWGPNDVGQISGVPTGTGFVAVAAHQAASMALDNQGRVYEFGFGLNLTDFPSNGRFVAIAAGYEHGLGLTIAGSVTQWGGNALGQRNGLPPGGGYKAIAAPSYNGISQRQDNTLQEWGTTSNNPSAGLYSGAVQAFGASPLSSAAWAMPADGSIHIWGDAFTVYQTNKPTGAGYVIGSAALGLNAANALLPLTDPSINGGAGQSTLVNTAFSTPLSVTVRDARNNPIQGLAITFTAPGGGASATFSNGQTSITVNTDASGVASTTATANASGGSYSVTASYPGLNSATFGLTNQNPLALTVINQGGNTPIPPNVLYSPGTGYLWVNFNQQPNNVSDTANYLLVSRSDGQDPLTTSCAALAPGDVDAGISSVSYNVPGNYAQVNFATFPAAMRFKMLVCATNRINAANSLTGPANTKLSSDVISSAFGTTPILSATSVTQNSAAGTTIGEGAALTSPVNSIYANMNSLPVSSTVSASSVKLFSGTPSLSGCANPGTAVTGTVSLNGNSIVFTPTSPLVAAGTYQFVVCGSVKGGNGALLGSSGVGASGVDFIRNFTISQTATTMSKTAGDGQSTVVSTPFSTNLKVTITDQTGAPISGLAVTFSIVAGGSGAAATFASSSVINTAADGSATAPTLTANAIAGAFTVSATAGSLTQTFNLTNIGLQGVTIIVPAGVSFSLNNTPYTGTQTIPLAPGSYPLSTSPTQSLGAGTQAVFTGWSDSGDIAHNITVASSPLSITGSFKTQYQLTVTAGTGGTALPASGTFYDANTVVNVSATANSGYFFNNWAGPVASPSAPSTTVTMTAPVAITANFTAKTTPVITWSNPANILFGSALSAVQLNATTNIPGTFVYTPAAGTVLPVGANQVLSVTFTPTDTVQYLPATKTVIINVTSNGGTPANLVVTNVISRDSGTQEIVVRITVANTGATTASNVRLTAIRIGSAATTTVLPAVLGDIPFGQTATTTIRIPASAGAPGAASSLSITGQHGTASNFGGSFRITLP